MRLGGAIETPEQPWGADRDLVTNRREPNQQRSGERVPGRHETGSRIAQVMNRLGRMGEPKLESSLILGLTSWRTPFFRLLHGVNREYVAP